jgi:hypothetical protein
MKHRLRRYGHGDNICLTARAGFEHDGRWQVIRMGVTHDDHALSWLDEILRPIYLDRHAPTMHAAPMSSYERTALPANEYYLGSLNQVSIWVHSGN